LFCASDDRERGGRRREQDPAQAPANLLSPFSYTQVIAATLFDIVCFGAIPDLWTLIGIAAIIGAGIYVMRSRS
jgi:drug/metabolite transporter (DMT)-like permease